MYSPINENARLFYHESRVTGLSLKAASTSDRVQKFVPSLSERATEKHPFPITRGQILHKKLKENNR